MKRLSARDRGGSDPRAFTIVEMLIGLAITAMIGVGVSSMLVMVSQGAVAQADLRRVNVKQRVIASRVNSTVRASKMVLAVDGSSLVLWAGDTRPNGRPNLSEIIRIEWQQSTNEIWAYQAPPNLPEEDDIVYGLHDPFDWITQTLAGTTDFPGQRWGTGVSAWTIAVDVPTVQHASLVRHDLTVEADDLASSSQYAAALRSR